MFVASFSSTQSLSQGERRVVVLMVPKESIPNEVKDCNSMGSQPTEVEAENRGGRTEEAFTTQESLHQTQIVLGFEVLDLFLGCSLR